MAERTNSFSFQKRIAFEQIEESLKEKCPIEYFKMVSILEYKTGLSKKMLEHFLVILADMGKIKVVDGKIEVMK
jgi:hypothetical protein